MLLECFWKCYDHIYLYSELLGLFLEVSNLENKETDTIILITLHISKHKHLVSEIQNQFFC